MYCVILFKSSLKYLIGCSVFAQEKTEPLFTLKCDRFICNGFHSYHGLTHAFNFKMRAYS